MAADGGLSVAPRPTAASAAWDEAAARDPVAAGLRQEAERRAAEQAARVEELVAGGVVDDVLAVVLQAEADGIPYGEIQDFLDDYLVGRWGDAASPLLQTILRTNVQSAFNDLRYLRVTSDPTRPYWRFHAVVDGRTSDTCIAAHGTTLPADDRWWVTHWPPLHHNCRSTVVPLTDDEVAMIGGTTERPPLTAALAAEGFGIPPEATPITVEPRAASPTARRDVPERYGHISFRPTKGMADAAERGVELHEEGFSGDGLKPETVRRAHRIAARETLTPEHVREMRAWFARHESDRRPGWAEPPTPGYVAWLLWGGDPGQSWSGKVVAQMDAADAED